LYYFGHSVVVLHQEPAPPQAGQQGGTTFLNASDSAIAAPRLDVGRRGPVWLGTLVVALALASALATFVVLAGMTPILPTHEVVVWMLLINVILVLLLLVTVAWQAQAILRARWAGAAGAGLPVRIVGLFSLVATLPAVLVAGVAMVTLERGLDPWFAGSLRDIMGNTVAIAEAFRDAQCRALARDSMKSRKSLRSAS
jgi:two-component system nitrogen regulation sensor histidine kinase NtrY